MADRPPQKRRSSRAPERPDAHAGPERLQKVLAAAGIGSRRECELYIVEGRVDVDGETVTELGTKVDPDRQRIRVDGVALPRTRRLYYAVNKPAGVVCTNRDPSGRTRVVDLIDTDERLFTVGRLDRTSEGLILVTNDGEFANRLTHPRYQVEKVYRVVVAGVPEPDALAELRRGVHLAEGMVRVDSVHITKRYKQSTELDIVIREGLNREIRRLLARVGHKVMSLKRIAIGTVRLSDLPLGAYRPLTRDELARLMGRGASRESGGRPSRDSIPTRDRKAARPAKTGSGKPRRSKGETGLAGRPAGQGSIIGGESIEPRRPAFKKSAKKTTRRASSSQGGKPGRPPKKSTPQKASRKAARKKRR